MSRQVVILRSGRRLYVEAAHVWLGVAPGAERVGPSAALPLIFKLLDRDGIEVAILPAVRVLGVFAEEPALTEAAP